MAETTADPRTTPFLARGHDHDNCIEAALLEAEAVCTARGTRLTALRRRVLEIVWQSHQPLGAYSILRILGGDGRKAAPPTVYRALGFLLENGLVHRIASLNAFVGCSRPGHAGGRQFLICHACGAAAELDNRTVQNALARSAAALGFRAQDHTVEVTGVCPNCQ